MCGIGKYILFLDGGKMTVVEVNGTSKMDFIFLLNILRAEQRNCRRRQEFFRTI